MGAEMGAMVAADLPVSHTATTMSTLSFDTKRFATCVSSHEECVLVARTLGERLANMLL